jgi:L-threonylcarbamoyladenylate synthase
MTCPTGTDIREAARIIRAGGLVAFPTETVYGLGADALAPASAARIFEAKDRPRFDPLIVHVADSSELDRLAADVPSLARALIERFWPGPLTLVLAKTAAVPDLVTSGLRTVAVRCPDHPVALDLLRQSGVPIAAPSANRFGRISPTTAEHVAEQLGDHIDYILDGGPCRVGVESTVLDVTHSRPVLLRPGGVPLEDIEAVIGPVAVRAAGDSSIESASAPRSSPGLLPHHYAPRTPLVISADASTETWQLASAVPRIGLLAFTPEDPFGFAAIETLSPAGDLRQAAAGFFAALTRLDHQDLDLIVARPFPECGLGCALNDRLRRAAADIKTV